MEEIWKDIPGYENYQVSNLGRVKSLDRIILYKNGINRLHKGKLMKATKNNDGYLVIALSKNSIRKQFKLHRLIMSVFKPIKNENEYVINHINGNKLDNDLSNLEWCTVEENNTHAIVTGLNRGKNILTDKEVINIKKEIEKLQPNTIRYISNEISKKYKVSPRTIEGIIVNKRWQHINT